MLKATAVRSPVMPLILPCPPCLLRGGGVQQGGVGSGGGGGPAGGLGGGGGGKGHFIQPVIYCTTTWCFALKGLRTMNVLLCSDTASTAEKLRVTLQSLKQSQQHELLTLQSTSDGPCKATNRKNAFPLLGTKTDRQNWFLSGGRQ